MTFQKCAVVVGIFVCYLSAIAARMVPCESYPFHPDCRGSQTKRASFQTDEPNYHNVGNLEDLFGITDNSGKSSYSSRSHDNSNNNYEKSRLWNALLDRGLNPDALYDRYLARLERNGANRPNFIQDNYSGKNLAYEDY